MRTSLTGSARVSSDLFPSKYGVSGWEISRVLESRETINCFTKKSVGVVLKTPQSGWGHVLELLRGGTARHSFVFTAWMRFSFLSAHTPNPLYFSLAILEMSFA